MHLCPGGPDIDNFLLDAYCWYGRHYGSSLHPPFSASLNFHSAAWIPADGKQVGFASYTWRTFPWTIFQLYDANLYCTAIYGSTCFFPIYELEIFPVVVAIRAVVKNFRGKSGVPLSGQRCIEIRFHSASASTSLGTTLVTDYVNFEHKCRFTAWLARIASHSNPADQPSRQIFLRSGYVIQKGLNLSCQFSSMVRESCMQATATRRMNLQGWTSKHPGLGKQAKVGLVLPEHLSQWGIIGCSDT